MIEEELYINNKRIDLLKNSIYRTFQINDFREVTNRQSNFSNSIKLPKTNNNVKALNLLGLTGIKNTLPYSDIAIKYVVNGIELISKGKGIIKKTDDFFNLVIYDGNISMTDILSDLTLSDLDFSNYNHNLNYTSFFNSFTNTSGYIYATDNDNIVNIGSTIPSFYIHSLFLMIFEQKGFTITGDIFNNSDFLSRITTMKCGFEQTLTTVLTNSYTNYNNQNRGQTFGAPTTGEVLVETFNVTATGSYKISFNGNIDVTFGTALIRIKLNNSSRKDILIIDPSIDDTYHIYAELNDDIQIFIEYTTEFDGGIDRYTLTENFTTNIDLDSSYFSIDFSEIIGDTKQIDFVKDVMQRFNLSYRILQNKKEIQFITSNQLLSSVQDSEDWSDKFIKKIDEEYFSNYAQENKFLYKYDNSEDTFADGVLAISNINLPVSKTILTSIFKASKKINGVYQLNYWNDKSEPNNDGLRIFKIDLNVRTFSFRLKEEYDNLMSINTTVADMQFNGISYQDEINNNYTKFKSVLNDFKIMLVYVYLNEIDIHKIDFFKLKHFKQLGRYFYLNKIDKYVPGKKVKVELIQAPIS